MEYRIVRSDGEERVVRSVIEGIKNDKGVLVRVVGASQDITDQVRARDRLQESEQLLRSAQQLAHVASWHWDLEADRVSCSEECIRIFGQPDDYEPSLEKLLAMMRRGLSTEFEIARPSGELPNCVVRLADIAERRRPASAHFRRLPGHHGF